MISRNITRYTNILLSSTPLELSSGDDGLGDSGGNSGLTDCVGRGNDRFIVGVKTADSNASVEGSGRDGEEKSG